MSLHNMLAAKRNPGTGNIPVPVAADWEQSAAILGVVRHYRRNSEIFAQGGRNDSFYRVVSGVVRTCLFFADGRRQIDAFYTAGDFFGLEISNVRLLTAEAVDDCSLLAYPRLGTALRAISGPASLQMLELALLTAERAREHALLLGRGCAIERVATFLIALERPARAAVIELPMGRNDIADYVGLTIETVSRTLTQLARDGVIEIRNVKTIVVLDGEQLRALAGC